MAEKLEIIVTATDRASSVLGKVTSAIGGVFKIAAGMLAADLFKRAGTEIVNFAKGSVTAASDLNETFNKVGVVFGDAAGAVQDFAAKSNGAIGLSQQAILDAASTFGVFGKSAGLAGGDLSDFSLDLTGLASDLSSFYNTAPEDAITAIGAALRGESEPIRRYGVLLDDATLRQKALEMGIISSTKKALTPQQRVLAAYQTILGQTSDAQGDFARTSDGLANSQRILSAQWENIKTQVGGALLPVVTKLAGFASKTLLPILGELFNGLLAKAGPILSNVTGWFDRMGAKVTGLMAYLKLGGTNIVGYLFGPDAAGKLSQIAAYFQPVIAAVQSFVTVAQSSLPMVQQYFADMWNFLLQAVSTIGPQLVQSVAGTINTITTFWQAHGTEVMAVVNAAWRVVVATIGGALVLAGGLIQGFVTLATGLWSALSQAFSGNWSGAWQTILSTVQLIGAQVWGAIQSFLNLALSIVGTNLEEFTSVWQTNFDMLVTIASTVLGNVVSTVRGKIGEFTNAGKDMIQGFFNGIKSKWGEVLAWLQAAIDAIPAWVKDALGISSPSKVFAEIGEQMMAGLAQGINGSKLPTVAIQATTTQLVNQVSGQARASAQSGGRGLVMYNPVFHIQTDSADDLLVQLQGLAA